MLNHMLPADFCVWLRMMLQDQGDRPLTATQTALMREALAGVFRHEIDPMMGDAAHLALLNKIHFPGKQV
jgi:hypothetical protein